MTELLSHYTDRAGLEGIAASRSFWATNFLDVNDTSEFLFSFSLLVQDAVEQALAKIPTGLRRTDYDLAGEAKHQFAGYRDTLRKSDGYGHLYMTSFARGKNEDHNRRGILTLWDRYTRHEGYCLQFARSDIEQVIQLDSWRANYQWVGLREISYGVDRNADQYRKLCFQMEQSILLQVMRARNDIRVEIKWQEMWPESYLARQLMDFCATHKDPCYEDEREIRIFAYPANQAEARVFTGIASPKKIRDTPGGKRYIVFGEHWRPGIVPRRIIIGPKANPDISNVLALFDGLPTVGVSGLPVA